ncbi:hypothetical protein GGS21DRAFT_383456 [Xylaria nigripes]|nr:hypothetical protein GGS21DRAFT_383456 [Xylaria nigripes]
MEVSASKRRKTSPTTSVTVNESSDPASFDNGTRRTSRLSRPSFASPTKSSLARSNPEVLQRRASSRENWHNEQASIPAASESGDPTSSYGSRIDPVVTQLGVDSEASRLPGNDGSSKDNATVEQFKNSVTLADGELSMKSKRSPEKPFPRPLPPPSAEEEELIDPFKGRKLRRSPPPGVLPKIQPEEPELPPTPIQKGLSDPSSVVTSSLGIHNTPSKRPRRSRALAARINSSPSRQVLPLRLPKGTMDVVEESASSQLARDPLRDEPKRKRVKPKFHPARQIEEPDPLADKKALRDSLLAEVAQLKDDLKAVSRENERLYDVQKLRHSTVDLPTPAEQGRLLDVLYRHALQPEKGAPVDTMQSWLEAAMNPIVFLPFGQANAVMMPPFVMPDPEKETATKSPSLVSHHPVSMTADEELPHLQIFTPLTFTSTVCTTLQKAQPENEQDPYLQRHAISIVSSPPGLFMAAIDMAVDMKTLSISELAVPQLDPSAVGELRPFVNQILRGANNSALTRNMSIITWAMGEWVRVATRRAWFWHAARHELGSTERIIRCADAMRRHTRRKPGRGQNQNDDEGDSDEDERGTSKKSGPSRADVISLLGRTSLDIDLSGAAGGGDEEPLTARFQWRIEFDWTGEAKSTIGLFLSAPAKWHANDGKGSLAGLSDMFDKLLEARKDPLEALKIVIALIVGDGRRP